MRSGAAKLLLIAAAALTTCQDKPQIETPAEAPDTAEALTPEQQFRDFTSFKKRDYAQGFKVIDNETEIRGYTQQLAYVGRDPRQYFGSKLKPARLCEPEILEQLHDDPIDKITALAREHRIVIINEAHDQARDRAFISKVVTALWDEGFTIYAAETFTIRNLTHDEWQAEVMERGFPVNNDGYYSNEPIFGQLLHTVLGLGYTPVAYETRLPYDSALTSAERMDQRETEQVNNLIERAIAKYPDQKIIVHVGFSHALETLSSKGNSWLAHRIKVKTGIDPLTIFQTKTKARCIIYGYDVGNGLDYKYFMPDPDTDNAPIPYRGFDMQLYPAEMRFTKGRPHWLADTGRKFIDIRAHLNIDDKWVMVEAVRKGLPVIDSEAKQYGMGAKHIPHDRVLVRGGEDIALALVPGAYTLTAYGINKVVVDTSEITVK